jgi:hypothetical protein
MPYKTTIKELKLGDQFYFPNDPELSIYKKLKDNRITGTHILFYCEKVDDNSVDEFYQDRSVMAFRDDEEKLPKPVDFTKKETPVLIRSDPKPPAIFKTYQSKINTTTMQHTSSTEVQIFTTSNYKLFKKIEGNRTINNRKIKKIIKEIDAGNDMLKYYPIQVQDDGTGTLNILDGQHRFAISKILLRPVFYILVKEEKSMPEIAKVNSNVEKWNKDDYINCYITAGNEDYKTLHDFIKTNGFSLGISLNMLSNGTPGNVAGAQKDLMTEFEQGTFKVKTVDYANELATIVANFNFFHHYRSRDFIIAIFRIYTAQKLPFTDLVDKVKANSNMLVQQANFKDYIYKIEQIVNIGKINRVVII